MSKYCEENRKHLCACFMDGKCARRNRNDPYPLVYADPRIQSLVSRRETVEQDGYRYSGDWPKRSGWSGRDPQSRESVSGTALFRSTLEALECLLREHHAITLSTDTDIDHHLSTYGRRAIRDMVLGPLDYWFRTYVSPPGRYRLYEATISAAFRVALHEWMERGASARKQLQRCMRQLLDALDDSKRG